MIAPISGGPAWLFDGPFHGFKSKLITRRWISLTASEA
jgi:hypothetical protein